MVVDQINIIGVACLKPEYDAPVRPDSNTPEVFQIAFQPMGSKAWQVKVFGLSGAIQNGKDVFHLLSLVCSDPSSVGIFKQSFQPFMPEAPDHNLD